MAPLAIATKKGFVEVFVIRVTLMEPPAAAEPAAAEPAAAEPEALPPAGVLHAVTRMATLATTPTLLSHLPRVDWFTWSSSAVLAALCPMALSDNVVIGL